MRVLVVENEEKAEKLREEMRENGNICPTAECYCMCKEFLMDAKVGQYCAFGLYKKVEE